MIGGSGHGWQTILADLSLILFLCTAQAYRHGEGAVAAAPPGPPQPTTAPARQADAATRQAVAATAPASAVFRPGSDAQLDRWLAEQAPDRRQMATVLVRRPANAGRAGDAAIAQGAHWLGRLQAHGVAARLLVEPDETAAGTLIVFGYDRPASDRGRADGTPLAYPPAQ